MPIYAPPATLAALGGGLLPKCDSRSLFQDRFADPQATDDTTPKRIQWFDSLIGPQRKVPPTLSAFDWLADSHTAIQARLMSRLLLNMAGGVMENAGLFLDRYGLPVVPGSAVKGCARRMALQALHDWIEHQTSKGSQERPAEDDACAPCCDGFKSPAEMLATISRVFGWVEQDWAAGRNRDPKSKEETTFKSDFGWATAGNGELMNAAHDLAGPSKSFTGTIAFLSAKPNTDPGLELDVVTPHHTLYYSPEPDRHRSPDKWAKWNSHQSAPDTEDPIPVFFPAVKSQEGTQNHFTFPLLPLRFAKACHLPAARTWLAHGLELFGIGAKNHSGYGWFQVLEQGSPAYGDRFQPRRSAVEKFVRAWGDKKLNSFSVNAFSKQVLRLNPADIRAIIDVLAPGKLADFKDPFWNIFKTEADGRELFGKLQS